MRWPIDKTLKERTAMIDQRVTDLCTDVEALKKHRAECDILHEQHKEHKRRSDDAMNNLTESNVALAKSITDVNVTITKIAGIIERDAPDIDALRNARIAFGVNKWIFLGLVAMATGVVSIVAAYNYFL